MMVIIFLLLTLLGLLQLWLLYKQQQRMKRLHKVETSTSRNLLTLGIQQYSFSRRIIEIVTDFQFHLLGKQNSMLLKHGIIVLITQAVGVYVNQEYLQLGLHIMLPAVFILTLYTLYLRARKKMRKEFETEFSEALNIINSSIRAGNSVTQGIDESGKKLDGMIGEEFRQISQRLNIGEDIESVFMDSYRRLPYREYYFFIITVLINMKGGGQLKEVMSRLGKLITDARVIERKKYAMTAEVRMSIKMLTAIPVFFFFFLKYQSPDSFDILIHHHIGQLILYYSISSILFGLLVAWLMMNKI